MDHRLLIWGAGGHAAVLIDLAQALGRTVAACVDDSPHGPERLDLLGVPVVGLAEAERLARSGLAGAVGIGHPRVRSAKADILVGWGCDLPPLVHPRAIVSRSAELGCGAIVCAGAVIGPLARIGRLAIVNTLASADHECTLAEASHLCPGARLAGKVSVGTGAWVGVGSCCRDAVTIGDWAFVGAGAAVVGNIAAGQLVVGVPARPRGRSPYAPE